MWYTSTGTGKISFNMKKTTYFFSLDLSYNFQAHNERKFSLSGAQNPGLWIRIRIGSGLDPDSMTLWILIRIESIRIHNPDKNYSVLQQRCSDCRNYEFRCTTFGQKQPALPGNFGEYQKLELSDKNNRPYQVISASIRSWNFRIKTTGPTR
jgi:hypothetical protein